MTSRRGLSPGLREWAKGQVAPDDATADELAPHWVLCGDVFIRVPKEKRDV